MLTDREQQIVDLLRRDPMMTPAAMAQIVGSSRAAINVHLSNLAKKGEILGRGYVLADRPGIVVIGGANMDIKSRSAGQVTMGTSNPGHVSMTPGGVGRNVAENLARLGDRVHFISVVGNDAFGTALLDHTSQAGVRIDEVLRTNGPTGTYAASLDCNGELLLAISDMAAIAELGPHEIIGARDVINSCSLMIVDGNLRIDTLDEALSMAGDLRVVVDPVSVAKARNIAGVIDHRVFAITPGRDELAALTDLPVSTKKQLRVAVNALHDRGIPIIWVSLGDRGSLLSHAGTMIEIPAVPADVDDVTGAGDSMLAAFCHVLLAGGEPLEAAHLGHAAAAATISSPHTVRPDLTTHLLENLLVSSV